MPARPRTVHLHERAVEEESLIAQAAQRGGQQFDPDLGVESLPVALDV